MAALEAFFLAFAQPMRHPPQLLAVVSLAMLMSLWHLDRVNQGLVWLGTGCAAGVAGTIYSDVVATDQLLLVSAVIAATLVAESESMSSRLCVVLANLIGLGIGLGSQLPNADASSRMTGFIGLSLGVCTWVFYGAAIARRIFRHWGERPLRMLGACAIAGAVMLLIGSITEIPFVTAYSSGSFR